MKVLVWRKTFYSDEEHQVLSDNISIKSADNKTIPTMTMSFGDACKEFDKDVMKKIISNAPYVIMELSLIPEELMKKDPE